jgi:hypothetical protein
MSVLGTASTPRVRFVSRCIGVFPAILIFIAFSYAAVSAVVVVVWVAERAAAHGAFLATVFGRPFSLVVKGVRGHRLSCGGTLQPEQVDNFFVVARDCVFG